jgi:tripartite-type tricarboxylate transporter receptor subunit TctC
MKTLDDFVALAKKSDRPLTFSTSGVGSSGQLFGEQLAQRLNVRFEHVPYKGAMQGLMDLVGGHIMFSAQTVTSSAGLIRGGALNAVAITAKERMPDFADVPTFKELGYPELVSTTWFALSGPAGLPPDIVRKVNGDIAKTMARPDIQHRMRQEGMVTDPLTPEELRQLIIRESAVFRPVLESAGLIEK